MMHETAPTSHETDRAEAWPPPQVAEVLGGSPEPINDPFYGDGQGFWFGPEQRFYLAMYPDHQRVELQTQHWIHSPRSAVSIRTTEEYVLFEADDETEQSTLILHRDGFYHHMGQQLVPEMEEFSREVERELRDRLDGGEESRPNPSSTGLVSGCVTTIPSVEPTTKPPIGGETPNGEVSNGDQEKQPRVKITGRVGREPYFSTTSRGVPKIRFPLGEHPDEDTTVWHNVYSTKKYAERIRDQGLKQGDEVNVTGVVHQRPITDKATGELKTEREIYAYGVKRTKQPNGG